MKWPFSLWWQRDIAAARRRADEAEREAVNTAMRRVEAEIVDARAKRVEGELRRELVRNNFAEALRAVFIGGDPA
ncbi:DUF7620 family protein [Mycolicibacterium goodii]|uniref:DUF7620 family protein n=1 Tax=Mycolicibacterium goodii TaxID=134601 RepID=UPI001BDD036D|nr:hypothetical protein [Mycolicibacterium goodii]MBU8830812.1 hypothetical protein [Mycolicibacterium goodii]